MSSKSPHGHIDQTALGRKNDYLYRLSIKALIMNDDGRVLVVKESGRTWWDLPGGGMDHHEDIQAAITRELKEEVNLSGDFVHKIIDVDDPVYLPNAKVYQVRLVFELRPQIMKFSPGADADEIAFMDVSRLAQSDNEVERKVAEYVELSTAASRARSADC